MQSGGLRRTSRGCALLCTEFVFDCNPVPCHQSRHVNPQPLPHAPPPGRHGAYFANMEGTKWRLHFRYVIWRKKNPNICHLAATLFLGRTTNKCDFPRVWSEGWILQVHFLIKNLVSAPNVTYFPLPPPRRGPGGALSLWTTLFWRKKLAFPIPRNFSPLKNPLNGKKALRRFFKTREERNIKRDYAVRSVPTVDVGNSSSRQKPPILQNGRRTPPSAAACVPTIIVYISRGPLSEEI
ncbi:hypothetical protein J6590_048569 [Homalodisca vitripennis]|nr:hypothetical protein J6590_048569 [Homalodisca vitripennis]